MKLELKHLAPYLPYGLKIWRQTEETSEILDLTAGKLLLWEDGYYTNFKPLLLPLSELRENEQLMVKLLSMATGSINVKNISPVETYGDAAVLFNCNGYADDLVFNYHKNSFSLHINNGAVRINVNNQLELFNLLFANHFDVFGLIEQNLALNKLTHA